MGSMIELIAQRGLWTRIERRDATGRLLDFVEVGQCAACGRGVDRDFPVEYRQRAGQLLCTPCAATTTPRRVGPAHRTAFDRGVST